MNSLPRIFHVVALSFASATVFLSFTNINFATELRNTAVVRAVKRAAPAVVNIHGHKTVHAIGTQGNYNDGMRRVNGMGTGVIIDERGYIITNHHVVDGVRNIQVTLENEDTVIASLVAHDPKTDLAIIKIGVERKLPLITIGTSRDLMPGEPVVAVGNAYGYTHTVTRGIISALKRSVEVSDTQSYANLIQTDASINPGNSGGPLLNIDGEMIGINVAVRVGAQGIGFALPVDEVMQVASRLMSVKRLENRGHGIVGQTKITNNGSEFVVHSVKRGSPAEKSGIAAGDVVVAVDGQKVVRALDVERFLLNRDADTPVDITLDRSGQQETASLALLRTSHRKASPVGDRAWEVIGVKVNTVPSSIVRQVSSRYRGGLKIDGVRKGSPAENQGIQTGDVLVGMHVWETISMDNLAYILNRKDVLNSQPIKFYILRGSETLYGHMPISVN